MAPTSNAPANSQTRLLRELGLRDAVAIVAGTVIGSGIFLIPSGVASQLSSLFGVLLVWITGGLLSLFGALALGELGAAFPGAGGLYVYLRQAYGKTVGFLYGWGLLTLIHSGSIATLAVAFRIYLAQIVPLTITQQKVAGVAGVLVLTAVNCVGVRIGKGVQNVFTLAKLGGLTLVVTLLFSRGRAHTLELNFWPKGPLEFHPSHFGIALIAVLWAYEGWHVVSFTAGEFKHPKRDLPRGLLYGTLIVATTYLLANIAYYCVLTPAQILETDRVAATAVSSVFGGAATLFISVLILVSMIGAANGMILTGPRVYYAMAADGLFFLKFGSVTARFRTPVFAIVVQGVWAACLTLLGTFQELFTYVIFTAWIFYGLAVAGVIVLRIRRPELNRPFRAPGYPWLPILFTVAALGIAVTAVLSSPLHAIFGIGLILSGLPVFAIFVERNKSKTSYASDSPE
jgi:basic amino acid/polyamine antiporter, APA family